MVGAYCKNRQESKKKKKKAGNCQQPYSHDSWRLGGAQSQVPVAPLALVISLHSRDQLLTAPETSVSTKHLASFSANFCTCCSCFPASLRFICRRKNWPGIFCFPQMCRMPDMALSSHSQEALKSQKDVKIRTPFLHEMMTSCLTLGFNL